MKCCQYSKGIYTIYCLVFKVFIYQSKNNWLLSNLSELDCAIIFEVEEGDNIFIIIFIILNTYLNSILDNIYFKKLLQGICSFDLPQQHFHFSTLVYSYFSSDLILTLSTFLSFAKKKRNIWRNCCVPKPD